MAQDALQAAPANNKKLFENDKIRVLEVEIKPGEKEPLHIHQWSTGVLIVTSPARLRYCDNKGTVILDVMQKGIQALEKIGEHSIENMSSNIFKAYRVELKDK